MILGMKHDVHTCLDMFGFFSCLINFIVFCLPHL